MITKPAAFRVTGVEPAPKGSLAGRCLTHPKVGQKALNPARVVISEDANRGRPFRRALEAAAKVHMPEQAERGQPLKVTVVFGVTRTAAAKTRMFPSLRSAQGIGGDLDKMVRLVLDALESAGVLADDAQVVKLEASKDYFDQLGGATAPGLYVRVEPVTPAEWVQIVAPLPYEDLADEERIG